MKDKPSNFEKLEEHDLRKISGGFENQEFFFPGVVAYGFRPICLRDMEASDLKIKKIQGNDDSEKI